jgi:type VI secretion system Hcp family effector
MAHHFLLTMDLRTQGTIKGSSKGSGGKKGDLDYSSGIECHGFQFGVEVPYDPQSGSATGKRQHSPIVIRKEVDSASPLLWQALCTNEAFQMAKLQFYTSGSSGKEKVACTVELTNGQIVGIERFPGLKGKPSEHLSLTFEKITVNGLSNALIPHWR